MLEEKKQLLTQLSEKVANLNTFLQISDLQEKVSELEKRTSDPSLWQDNTKAKSLMREMNILRNKINQNKDVNNKLEELKILIELANEDNKEELNKELQDLNSEISKYELSIILNDSYDSHDAIFSITAGAGGTDAQDWAEMLSRMYIRWFEKRRLAYNIVDLSPGEEAGIKSTTIIVGGEYAYGYLKAEAGIHRLVRLSPFNANSKRHTSFASVEVIPEIDNEVKVDINPDDLRVDTFKASGAGGQHVNKTDSAVRITHIPTGIVTQCQNERSQLQNKETAMKILISKIVKQLKENKKEEISELKGNIKEIAWGHQIRSYVFHPYSLVKDLRTNYETANIQKVMDGDIDDFINAYLLNYVATVK